MLFLSPAQCKHGISQWAAGVKMCDWYVVLHPGASLTYHTDQKQTHKIQGQVKLTAHHKVQVQFSSVTSSPSTGNQSTAPVCDWEIEGRRKGPV